MREVQQHPTLADIAFPTLDHLVDDLAGTIPVVCPESNPCDLKLNLRRLGVKLCCLVELRKGALEIILVSSEKAGVVLFEGSRRRLEFNRSLIVLTRVKIVSL